MALLMRGSGGGVRHVALSTRGGALSFSVLGVIRTFNIRMQHVFGLFVRCPIVARTRKGNDRILPFRYAERDILHISTEYPVLYLPGTL